MCRDRNLLYQVFEKVWEQLLYIDYVLDCFCLFGVGGGRLFKILFYFILIRSHTFLSKFACMLKNILELTVKENCHNYIPLKWC